MVKRRKVDEQAAPPSEEEEEEEEEEEGEGDDEEGEDESDDAAEDIPLEEAEGAEEELQVEFGFFDPKEDDTPLLRSMLQAGPLVRFADCDTHAIASLLAEQVRRPHAIQS